MGYKILSLDMPAFIDVCQQLQEIVVKSGFTPDVIIPVPRGGNRVATYLFADTKQIPLTLVRPPKGIIKSSLATGLRMLPECVIDMLRIAEAKILVRKRNHMDNTSIILPKLPPELKNILIIDDAVDSGATLKAIVEKFAEKYTDRNVRTAVITVTYSRPTYRPDYAVFDNRTLIRTPWSIDSRIKRLKKR